MDYYRGNEWLQRIGSTMKFVNGAWQIFSRNVKIKRIGYDPNELSSPIIEEVEEEGPSSIFPGMGTLMDPLHVGEVNNFVHFMDLHKSLRELSIISGLEEEQVERLKNVTRLTNNFLSGSSANAAALVKVINGITKLSNSNNLMTMGGGLLKDFSGLFLMVPEVGVLLSGGSYALGSFLQHLGEEENMKGIVGHLLSSRHGIFNNVCANAYAEKVHMELEHLDSITKRINVMESWILDLHDRMVQSETIMFNSGCKMHGLQFWSFENYDSIIGVVAFLGVKNGVCVLYVYDLKDNSRCESLNNRGLCSRQKEIPLGIGSEEHVFNHLKLMFLDFVVAEKDIYFGCLMMYSMSPCFAPDWIIYDRIMQLDSILSKVHGSISYKRSYLYSVLQNGVVKIEKPH